MIDQLVQETNINNTEVAGRDEMEYAQDAYTGQDYTWLLGDSYDNLDSLPDNSVGLWVSSWPFAGMYTYSNSPRDVGNNRDHTELTDHARYIMTKALQKTMPGRGCAVHIAQEPIHKWQEGYTGIRDFRGEVIRLMQEVGWIFYGEVTIDKDPQVKAARTKEVGLLFKTLATDSAKNRMALADYLLYFIKPGENPQPIRAGISAKYGSEGWITNEEWIEWAHPVWYGIRETNVLNVRVAKEEDDERHLCPLQLDVITRAIKLWSAPGDLVGDMFGGIGSTLYEALRLNRRAWGSELKRSYWETGKSNIRKALASRQQTSMFDLLAVQEAQEVGI
jgi:DNA modification methylase